MHPLAVLHGVRVRDQAGVVEQGHLCGPIVEQATHLASLSLLFGGPARLKTVRTHTVEHSDAPGKLSKLGFDEEATVPPSGRIPRYTAAVWKYKADAVGSLTHVVGLHGNTYDTEFEVICDGTTFRLVDMYTSTPRLFIRQSDKSAEGACSLTSVCFLVYPLTGLPVFLQSRCTLSRTTTLSRPRSTASSPARLLARTSRLSRRTSSRGQSARPASGNASRSRTNDRALTTLPAWDARGCGRMC